MDKEEELAKILEQVPAVCYPPRVVRCGTCGIQSWTHDGTPNSVLPECWIEILHHNGKDANVISSSIMCPICWEHWSLQDRRRGMASHNRYCMRKDFEDGVPSVIKWANECLEGEFMVDVLDREDEERGMR